jgi:polar amino acid transport system substrate-binding protein
MDYEGWLSSSTTVDAAIADGLPIVEVGDPVFYEPLAAAFDKGIEDNDSLVAAVDAIIGEMHEDGTLSELSMTWFGEDLTKRVGE